MNEPEEILRENLPQTLRACAKSAEETNPDLWPLTMLMLQAANEIERLRNEQKEG